MSYLFAWVLKSGSLLIHDFNELLSVEDQRLITEVISEGALNIVMVSRLFGV